MPFFLRHGISLSSLSLQSNICSASANNRQELRRFYHPKEKERNLLAATCSMVVIVILCTALAEPNWIVLQGGGCNFGHIGVYHFFYAGYFEMSVGRVDAFTNYHITSHTGEDSTMVNCVTPRVVTVFKSVIGLTFLGIFCSTAAFLLDLFGAENRVLRIVRRNAICNILTVMICVVINGFCFWATGIVLRLQNFTKPHLGSKVVVTFDISFYLIVAAGAVSVIATACNCLRRHPHIRQEDQRELLDDFDDMDIVRPLSEPPPPAYSP